MQRVNILWIRHNPSMRIGGMRVLRLGAVLLAMLGTLAFAGSAYAGVRADPLGTSEVLEAEGAQSGPSGEGSPEGRVTPGGEEQHETPPIVEEHPEATPVVEEPKVTPPVVEEPKVTPPVVEEPKVTPPVVEEPLESPPPPVVEEHLEPRPIVEEHPENTPTVTVLGESPQTPPATGQGTEEAAKGLHTGQGSGEGSEGGSASSRTLVSPDSTLAQPALAHSAAAEESAAALLGLPPTVGGPRTQASATPAAGVIAAGARAAMTAARRAGALSCQLTALGDRTTDDCTVGWLGGKRFSASPVGLIPEASSLAAAATAGLSGGGGHGGSSGGNAPVGPAPGPAPGGASGAAVGGGAPGGVALSNLHTLAGLLLLSGPRAMRRLRLSCQPWLTACFVLIPERPG
jgi:outer membrane biosynthesis protein TonB